MLCFLYGPGEPGRYPHLGCLMIRFRLKHLFGIVLFAALLLMVTSAITESRSWAATQYEDLGVSATIYNIGPAVVKKFDVELEDWQRYSSLLPNPYEDVSDRYTERRNRFFGRFTSIEHHVVFRREIDVRIQCVNRHGFLDAGIPEILIIDNGAPNNLWYISEFNTFLSQTFGLNSEVIESPVADKARPKDGG